MHVQHGTVISGHLFVALLGPEIARFSKFGRDSVVIWQGCPGPVSKPELLNGPPLGIDSFESKQGTAWSLLTSALSDKRASTGPLHVGHY
jgi:hypothetical protein